MQVLGTVSYVPGKNNEGLVLFVSVHSFKEYIDEACSSRLIYNQRKSIAECETSILQSRIDKN